ncbi:SDR family NAD(P)-dependent oxidoreductase [Rhizobium lusitanum]|uniref:SDR family NAD(P)-dependent oxidoreductase n=1 Tax=Rhizobium lusitanum TaxID=293958 RepID=A0A6L9UEM4_9HYPH|nr:SDR family NAD(P)-dependent oxidoreductase [Rhizobium lusitanum]NEI74104.1 SDR family NAD(P)-dependent oxidoreductase [Rhizobium lusitanum]
MAETKVWFITGASRGFGRIWAEAALARGDKVAAAVRDTKSLLPLKQRYGEAIQPLALDVTNRKDVFSAMAKARANFGRVDVVINNAGFGLMGAIEEVTENDARTQMDTNFFGSLWVTQAALPLLREQGAGHVISVSSVSGLIGQPTIGLYNASKWALEGIMEALSKEIEGFGVKVTLVEPGPYATEFTSANSLRLADSLPVYDTARANLLASILPEDVDDPSTTAKDMLALVDSECPPLRVLWGKSSLAWAIGAYGERLASWGR